MTELALKQEKYFAKCKLRIATKVTNPLHAQRIGYIAVVNMRISSENYTSNILKNS